MVSLVVLVSIVLSGCGSSSSSPESSAINSIFGFYNAAEDGNVSKMSSYLSSDFIVVDGFTNEVSYTREEYIASMNLFMNLFFSSGGEMNSANYENKVTNNVSDNLVQFNGIVSINMKGPDGSSSNRDNAVQFTVEKISGSWKITKFIQ